MLLLSYSGLDYSQQCENEYQEIQDHDNYFNESVSRHIEEIHEELEPSDDSEGVLNYLDMLETPAIQKRLMEFFKNRNYYKLGELVAIWLENSIDTEAKERALKEV